MKRSEKQKIKTRHFENLAKILGLTVEGVEYIYPHLKRIERDGHRLAEKYCNGEVDSEQIESLENKLKSNLDATLKYSTSHARQHIKFNWDPRGYFLKFHDEYIRKNNLRIETDWGGYGIVCPEDV